VVELATVLSPAVRIEASLLRAARLTFLPSLDPGTESDLWWSPLVGSRGVGAITLRPDVAAELRGELARDREYAGRVCIFVEQAHGGHSPLVLLEEAVIRFDLLDSPGADQEIEKLLQSVLKTMLSAPERTAALAHWVDRALPGFRSNVRRSETAGLLGVAAASRLGKQARLIRQADLPIPGNAGWVLERPTAQGASIAALFTDAGLEFVAASTEGAASVVLSQPLPALVEFSWQEGTQTKRISRAVDIGAVVAFPADVSQVRLRTLDGTEIDFQVPAPAVPEAPADRAWPDMRGYRVAKVLVVGADTAATRGLIEALAPEPRGTAFNARVRLVGLGSADSQDQAKGNPEWIAALADRDPSVALALAAITQAAGPGDTVALSELVLAYREAYRVGYRTVDGSTLERTVDDVRDHLIQVVLPRLATEGWITDTSSSDWESVKPRVPWWASSREGRQPMYDALLAAARRAARSFEEIALWDCPEDPFRPLELDLDDALGVVLVPSPGASFDQEIEPWIRRARRLRQSTPIFVAARGPEAQADAESLPNVGVFWFPEGFEGSPVLALRHAVDENISWNLAALSPTRSDVELFAELVRGGEVPARIEDIAQRLPSGLSFGRSSRDVQLQVLLVASAAEIWGACKVLTTELDDARVLRDVEVMSYGTYEESLRHAFLAASRDPVGLPSMPLEEFSHLGIDSPSAIGWIRGELSSRGLIVAQGNELLFPSLFNPPAEDLRPAKSGWSLSYTWPGELPAEYLKLLAVLRRGLGEANPYVIEKIHARSAILRFRQSPISVAVHPKFENLTCYVEPADDSNPIVYREVEATFGRFVSAVAGDRRVEIFQWKPTRETEAPIRAETRGARSGTSCLVYVSCTAADFEDSLRAFLDRVKPALEKRLGRTVVLNGFLPSEMALGSEVEPEATNQIAGAELFLAIVSEDYLDSSWCGRELAAFRSRPEARDDAAPLCAILWRDDVLEPIPPVLPPLIRPADLRIPRMSNVPDFAQLAKHGEIFETALEDLASLFGAAIEGHPLLPDRPFDFRSVSPAFGPSELTATHVGSSEELDWVLPMLNTLALAFHVGDVDHMSWDERRDFFRWKAAEGFQDFQHVWTQLEFIFSGPVGEFLRKGIDPMKPQPDAVEMLTRALKTPDDIQGRFAVLDSVKALIVLGNDDDRLAVTRAAGISLANMVERLDLPNRQPLSDGVLEGLRKMIPVLARYTSDFGGWQARNPSTFRSSPDFPTYIQSICDAWLHYVDMLIERKRDTVVEVHVERSVGERFALRFPRVATPLENVPSSSLGDRPATVRFSMQGRQYRRAVQVLSRSVRTWLALSRLGTEQGEMSQPP
jgi:hypothetical protein